MDRVRARVKDKRVLGLVKAFLKAGVLTELGGRRRHLDRHAARRRHHAPNAIDNFCFDVTLSYRRLERPRRVTGGE